MTTPEPTDTLSARERALQRWFPALPDNGVGDWREQAACATVDPELFYPEQSHPAHPALSVCRRCPVQAECLEYAMTNNENFGIWGGHTPNQRHRLKRGPGGKCKEGHALTPENTRLNSTGFPVCVTCSNTYAREQKRKQRQEGNR